MEIDQRIFEAPSSTNTSLLALYYDPSTKVTKKSDIRKPYYDRYVTNGKMVLTAHARKIFVTFIMLLLLCRHFKRCRHNSDKIQLCHSLVTSDKTLSLLCHPCQWVVIEALKQKVGCPYTGRFPKVAKIM